MRSFTAVYTENFVSAAADAAALPSSVQLPKFLDDAALNIPYTIYSLLAGSVCWWGCAESYSRTETKPQTVALLIHFRHPPCPSSACLAVGGAFVVLQLSTVAPGSFCTVFVISGIKIRP